MIRRRRPVREIAFSFDSFLDIVANVVGVIIRLILVVWVGARSYSSLQTLHRPTASAEPASSVQADPADPVQAEMARHRRELAEAQERLLAQLRRLQELDEVPDRPQAHLAALTAREKQLAAEHAALEHTQASAQDTRHQAALTSAELRQRSQKLAEEIRALEQLPPATRTLHYRTPISRPVHSEELFFECNRGRVTFIDVAGLIAEIRDGLEERGRQLRTRWEVSDTTAPVGAFRLRFTIERQRSLGDGVASTAPSESGSFRYGLTGWQVEPAAFPRGEPAETALAEGSQFRQIVDTLDPQMTTVTFWVYPDSFDLFRRLRDYLYDRDVVVAGRPLPPGVPIASSRSGTLSQGQ
jgi:hypothetical protein